MLGFVELSVHHLIVVGFQPHVTIIAVALKASRINEKTLSKRGNSGQRQSSCGKESLAPNLLKPRQQPKGAGEYVAGWTECVQRETRDRGSQRLAVRVGRHARDRNSVDEAVKEEQP
jgi:hypothetical protein